MQNFLLLFIVQLPLDSNEWLFLQSAFDIIQNRFCALKLDLNDEKNKMHVILKL